MSDLKKIAPPSRNSQRGNSGRRPNNTMPGIGIASAPRPTAPIAPPPASPPAEHPCSESVASAPEGKFFQEEVVPVSAAIPVPEQESEQDAGPKVRRLSIPQSEEGNTIFSGNPPETAEEPVFEEEETVLSREPSAKSSSRIWIILSVILFISVIVLAVLLLCSGKNEKSTEKKTTAKKQEQSKQNVLPAPKTDHSKTAVKKQPPEAIRKTSSPVVRKTTTPQQVSALQKNVVPQNKDNRQKEEIVIPVVKGSLSVGGKKTSVKKKKQTSSIVKPLSAAEAKRAYFWISNPLSVLQKAGDSAVIDCLYPNEKIVSVTLNGKEEIKVIDNKISKKKISFSGTETTAYSFTISYNGKCAVVRLDQLQSDVPHWTSFKLSSGKVIYCSWNRNCQVPPAKEIGVCLRDGKFLVIYNLDQHDSAIIGKDPKFFNQVRVRFFENGKRKAYSYLSLQSSSLVGELELRFPEYNKIMEKNKICSILSASLKDPQLQERALDIYRYLDNLERNRRKLQNRILTTSDESVKKETEKQLQSIEYARKELLRLKNIFYVLARNGFKTTYRRGGRTYTTRRTYMSNPFTGKRFQDIALVMQIIAGKYTSVSERIGEYMKDFPTDKYLYAPSFTELRRAREDIRKRLGDMEGVLVKHKKIFRSIERVNSL